MPQPWTPRMRPPLLGKREDAFPTPPTAVLVLALGRTKNEARTCARGRSQTILTPPTAWPLFKRSSVAAFERSVTLYDSSVAFCYGLPGSMGAVSMALSTSQQVLKQARAAFIGATSPIDPEDPRMDEFAPLSRALALPKDRVLRRANVT